MFGVLFTSGEAFLASLTFQFRLSLARPLSIATGVFSPLLMLMIAFLPRSAAVDPLIAGRLIFGSLLASFWSASVWSASGILRRERWLGTLSRTVTGVTDARLVLLGRVVGATLWDLVLVITTTVFGAWILRIDVDFVSWPRAVLALLITLAAGSGASLLIGSILIVTRHGMHIATAIGVPVLLLGGMMLPVNELPVALRPASYLLATYWITQFVTQSSYTAFAAAMIALCLTAAYAMTGSWVFNRTIRRARVDGTLELI